MVGVASYLAPFHGVLHNGSAKLWISADIDGRKTKFEGGPQRKDGGFDLTVFVRSNGGIDRAVNILGRADENGNLTIRIDPTLPVKDRRSGDVLTIESVR